MAYYSEQDAVNRALTDFSFSNISAPATTTVKTGAGVFKRLVFNKPVASGVITIYDNTAASGTKIATITEPATLLAQGAFSTDYDLLFSTGLTVVTSAADDITIVYK